MADRKHLTESKSKDNHFRAGGKLASDRDGIGSRGWSPGLGSDREMHRVRAMPWKSEGHGDLTWLMGSISRACLWWGRVSSEGG